jgi:uroporphyrinogen decarboxylase
MNGVYMTHKERFLAAARYKRPDMPALEYNYTGVGYAEHGAGLQELYMRYPGDTGPTPVYEPGRAPAPDPADFGTDGRYRRIETDNWGVTWEYRVFGRIGHAIGFPLDDMAKLDEYVFPTMPLSRPGAFEALKRGAAGGGRVTVGDDSINPAINSAGISANADHPAEADHSANADHPAASERSTCAGHPAEADHSANADHSAASERSTGAGHPAEAGHPAITIHSAAEHLPCAAEYPVSHGVPGLLELMLALRPFDKVLMDLASGSPALARLADRLTDAFAREVELAVAAGVDIIRMGDDYGTEKALLISPDMWREFFFPRLERILAPAKKAGVLCCFHSCGQIWDILPDLRRAGVDTIWPQLPLYDYGEFRALLRDIGLALSIHIDRGELMQHGSPDDVKAEVRRIYQAFRPDEGGSWFYFEVDEGFPFANIQALAEAIAEYRK